MSEIVDQKRASGSSHGAAAASAREPALGTADDQTQNARLAELRTRYLKGRYKVNAPELSSAIIAEHLNHR